MNSNSILNNKSVACPLDCFDACEAIYENKKCKGNKEHKVTNGKLCVNFANLLKEDFLKESYLNPEKTLAKNLTADQKIKLEKISLDKSLDILVEKLENTEPSKTIYYKGSGNLGLMQSSPKTFFSKYGATFTKGDLCEGPGSNGLNKGRKHSSNPPIQNLIDSEIIIAWGRNFSITSPHMYNLVKDKTFITIDPIKTPIAKKSELHLQINPKTDYELALLLTRFAYMEDMEDEEFIQNHGHGADWFFDLAKQRPVVSYEETTGVSLNDITKFYELIKGKKVSIMLGLGVQKYYEGSQITRVIDSYAAYIGLHNKSAGGVWYIGDSTNGYENKFEVKPKKTVSLPEVDFASYDLVFIQGANPVVSSPNTQRVIEGLEKSFVVFYGTTLNETSRYADLIIPSSDFLSKKDIRISYGHELKAISNVVIKKDENTISEYELTQYLNNAFSFEKIKEEDEILDYYKNARVEGISKIETFEFIEEIEIDNLYESKKEDEYYFITAKRKENLNSQFNSDDSVYLHPKSGFKTGDKVILSSKYGKAFFLVSINEDIKEDCAFCFAGNKNSNYLSNHKSDEEADSAMFQEVLIHIELS